jgi:GT2 family glycosyltransferase
MPTVNIIILNYNGYALLQECLPSVIEAAAGSKYHCRVTVLDNRSSDGSVDFIKNNFPTVDISLAQKNRLLFSYNDYVSSIEEEIVILLNSDIKVDRGFVDPLVECLDQNEDAFVAGPQCWTFDKSRYEGALARIKFKFGLFQCFSRYPGYQADINKPGYTANIGSYAAFNRKKFLELGGYDPLYFPGRCEDLDICYRGWKHGWKGYYVPQSIAYHKGQESFNREFGCRRSLIMAYRNTFYFIWKNITGPRYLFQHLILILPRLSFALFKGDFSLVFGFFQALPNFLSAVDRRKVNRGFFRKTDAELLRLLGW